MPLQIRRSKSCSLQSGDYSITLCLFAIIDSDFVLLSFCLRQFSVAAKGGFSMKKMIALLSAAVMAVAVTAQMSAYAASTELAAPAYENKVTAVNTAGFTAEVVRLVNQERSRNGLSELKMFPKLSHAASIRADETVIKWDHTRPDGSSITTLCSQLGIKWSRIGENIAYGQNSPQMVMNSWMNSPDHKSNILNSDYQYIGVGVTEANGRLYWTQFFVGTTEAHPEAFSPKDYGDVNGDSKVNAVDASLVLADYAATGSGKSSSFSAGQRAKADVSGDDAVNAVDASQILSIYAKNSTS